MKTLFLSLKCVLFGSQFFQNVMIVEVVTISTKIRIIIQTGTCTCTCKVIRIRFKTNLFSNLGKSNIPVRNNTDTIDLFWYKHRRSGVF